MKQFGLLITIVMFYTSVAYAQDLAKGRLDTSLVDHAINALNEQDIGYFEKRLATNVVWLDEDGHAISGKERVTTFINRRLMIDQQKIVTQNVKVLTSDNSTWGYFSYAIEVDGDALIKGLGSVVFHKLDNDWQIVLVHGAHNVGTHN